MPNSPDNFKHDAALLIRPGDTALQPLLIEKMRSAMIAQQRICGKPMGSMHALEWVALDLLQRLDEQEARVKEFVRAIIELRAIVNDENRDEDLSSATLDACRNSLRLNAKIRAALSATLLPSDNKGQ